MAREFSESSFFSVALWQQLGNVVSCGVGYPEVACVYYGELSLLSGQVLGLR